MTVTPGLTRVFRVVTWITTGIRPRQWVAVHRKHHAFTDVEGDPHSPHPRGLPQGPALQRRCSTAGWRATAPRSARYARDLPADRWDRPCSTTRCSASAIGIAILCVLFGPWLGLLAALVHVVLYLALNAAVNAVGHTFGKQPHPNLAANSQWLAWLAAGEGLHNNHHAAPTSARLSMGPGEVDPAWPVIRFLERRGWVQVRHAKPKLKQAAAA